MNETILVNNTNLSNEECSTMNENNKHNKNELEQISKLLNSLIELQTKSTKLETAIKQQGREIKMNIFPDGYDKRTAPPRVNGMIRVQGFKIYF